MLSAIAELTDVYDIGDWIAISKPRSREAETFAGDRASIKISQVILIPGNSRKLSWNPQIGQ